MVTTLTDIERRLARGAAWLTARWAALEDVDDPAFRRAVDLWARLHDEAGGPDRASCSLGDFGPCKADAFLSCSWCCREEGRQGELFSCQPLSNPSLEAQGPS